MPVLAKYNVPLAPRQARDKGDKVTYKARDKVASLTYSNWRPPVTSGPTGLRRRQPLSLSLSTKRRDKVWGRSVADKVWRQSCSAKRPLKPTLNPTLNRHAHSTRLLFRSLSSLSRLLLAAGFTSFAVPCVVLWGRHSCLPSATRADRNVRATLGQFPQWRIGGGMGGFGVTVPCVRGSPVMPRGGRRGPYFAKATYDRRLALPFGCCTASLC